MTTTVDPKKTAVIIYRPQYDEPPMTEFAGIQFKANEPVEVPYSKTVDQLLVEKFETVDGVRSRAVERKVPVINVLRQVVDGKTIVNPSFEIDGVVGERIKPHARMPETSDEYRGYCINWISVSMSADSMDKRWIGEEGLRQRCGCSPSDIAYLRPFFEARRMECAELDKQRHIA